MGGARIEDGLEAAVWKMGGMGWDVIPAQESALTIISRRAHSHQITAALLTILKLRGFQDLTVILKIINRLLSPSK